MRGKTEYRSGLLWALVESPEGNAMTKRMETVGMKTLQRRGLWGLIVAKDSRTAGVLWLGRN